MQRGDRSVEAQRGTTFIAVLVLLAICMFGLSVAGPVWSQAVRREREQDLIRVGVLYARALAAYRDASPGSLKQFPIKLDALLLDTRYVGVARHLRALYGDPVNDGLGWGLIKDSVGGIVGVQSLSDEAPIAQGLIDLGDVVLTPAKHYSEWKFMVKAKS